MIYIQNQKCIGCGACINACPVGAIQLVNGLAAIDQDKCQQCEVCLTVCPENAISTILDIEPVPVTPGHISVPSQTEGVPYAAPKVSMLPWVGTALAFVGREILPRVAVSLLEAWDRRMRQPTSISGIVPSASPKGYAPHEVVSNQRGRMHRQRRRGQF